MTSPTYCVYIMGSESGTLYVGVTNNLGRRVFEHKNHLLKGFTATYHCTKLLYFEETNSINEALEFEKKIKNWRREKKEWLITQHNPGWRDLSLDLELTPNF
ncbi:endonuclease [Candidatus Cerribacteria bacterium 'Amazon FNV 2010 28 9']|uniref:Endonuclease n=1 Tax=Candidatus Cerribacteria bacterium 'Amazon FNV 2010 28 9' TaxID=2081795 RepID=A0A317JSM4_9BACT|nr:MAG: endonuclease [Candidatus Cerribacteria bacterium 'Amazon FNV 2010 28 9']